MVTAMIVGAKHLTTTYGPWRARIFTHRSHTNTALNAQRQAHTTDQATRLDLSTTISHTHEHVRSRITTDLHSLHKRHCNAPPHLSSRVHNTPLGAPLTSPQLARPQHATARAAHLSTTLNLRTPTVSTSARPSSSMRAASMNISVPYCA